MGWVMSSLGMVRMGTWVTLPVLALQHAGPLVERGQVGIEVGRIALSAGDLALGGGEFPQRLAVGGHIGHDDQDVHAHG